ncbi:putative metallopeptidase, partial [Pseudomonas syringae group genomosp. 7]|uniref:putative metallopeptidase n=1 Tax=Pseudomonas syringae group genomosp. 7 TaxID=251699 RepID=UPI0037702BF5
LAAESSSQSSDADFSAQVAHERYHIAPAVDQNGAPNFTQDGLPKLEMRGHDVEDFVGEVRRYGASPDVQLLVDAA